MSDDDNGIVEFPKQKMSGTLDYNRWVAEGYLEVVKNAICTAADDPHNEMGKYNFEIGFKTDYPGVDAPEWIVKDQPTLKIILNNQYFDLEVINGMTEFAVTLFFNEVETRITIPFKSIVMFKDGHNGFLLSYEYPPEKPKKPVVELVPDEPEVAEIVSLDAFRNKGDEDK